MDMDIYSETGPERCGFILKTGELIETQNISTEPESSFLISAKAILEFEDSISAVWHTHPGSSSNLSGEDYKSFINYPEWKHLIIGSDGITCYSVNDRGQVVKDAAKDYPSWTVEKAHPNSRNS